ncbi:unnamed protein product [Peniophora sp. CBMAI 1063]|nr:unnamed protein product [Peniophora sp. CBMAI 1063]
MNNDPEQYTKDALSSLASTVTDKAPYFGSLPLHVDTFKIYFDDKNGQAQAVNTANATIEQLNALAAACSIAPFGRGAEAVVDDSYRKAGKLDLPHFAIPFEPEATALVAGIKDSVLEGKAAKRPVRFELYKLNVYGEGGFFKSHKDTPRGAAMFGSLVLVYPTTHTGGALVFRHHGHEWVFDSAAAVHQDGAPAFGYAAFYSDVEHEVLPVTSGYRVTVTYNLYFDDAEDGAEAAVAPPPATATAFATHLQGLLDDPQFLPEGGYLGFGLRHSYPIQFTEDMSPMRRGVQHLLDVLKGADAIVLRAAREAGLPAQLHIAYDTKIYVGGYRGDREITALTTQVMGGDYTEYQLWQHLRAAYGAAFLWPKGHKKYQAEREVHWVTPRTGGSQFTSVMLTYGNDPSLDYHYAELCLLLAVGPAGDRTGKENLTVARGDEYHDWDDRDYRSDPDDYAWPAEDKKEEKNGAKNDDGSDSDPFA